MKKNELNERRMDTMKEEWNKWKKSGLNEKEWIEWKKNGLNERRMDTMKEEWIQWKKSGLNEKE